MGAIDELEVTVALTGQAELDTKSASRARSAVVVMLTGMNAGHVHRLDEVECIIGRGAGAHIHVEGNGVSRRHARLCKREDDNVELTDLGSRNGTYCNGVRVESRVLESGDKIQIGDTTVLRFDYQDALEEEYQRRLYESATRDALTGCFNKKYFSERIKAEMAFAVRNKKPLSLAMFDVDFFKRVNDTHGHTVGDEVLRSVGAALREDARVDDLVARYGGEEFVMIMRDCRLEEAFVAVERLRKHVESLTIRHEDTTLRVTMSCGIAVCEDGRLTDPTGLIAEADRFLYAAKLAGRNRTKCELTR